MDNGNNFVQIIDVTSDNVADAGFYCIKDKKAAGYHAKLEWFQSQINAGLEIKIALNSDGKQVGFIEYVPSELVWRPIRATNFLIIQCIAVIAKDSRDKGIGTSLIKQCEIDARAEGKSGICAFSSNGPWIANKSLFEKNNFVIEDRLDRFELMVKYFNNNCDKPKIIDWTAEQKNYTGWHLIYSNQCPWHTKSVTDLTHSAINNNIVLNITKLISPEEAQNAPTGFGTFALIKDGKLLADHYISKTRFENILRNEIKE